ncbi:Dihydrolipoamide acetyltransferase component of pyruvate dehydrogenase complex [Leifsonia rubra CMS 76R]|nr:Dihydrolipoamide acetyltransferase component of pyruvate dehydrogenase complex [Leifsonia rubra CMS 76R]
MPEVTMPRLSDTMEEGELARWLKQVGDVVEKGDVIAEIETDKATMDLEAFESGVLQKHLVDEGTLVPVGQAVAVIGDSAPSEPEPDPEPEPEAERDATAAVEVEAEPEPVAESKPTTKKASSASSASSASAESAESASTVDKLRMSPLARKLAHDNDIDLDSVTGSGPNGRIIRVDVDAAITAAADSLVDSTGAKEQPKSQNSDAEAEVIPLSKIRKVTAKRLTQSQEIPHFFLTNVVEVDRLMVLRREVNEGLETQGVKVSLNDFIVKAVAITLRQHPEANVSFNGDSLLRHPRINVGIAVATDAGLLVPVVTDADRKSLSEIGAEVVALASAARDGKLKLDQMSGGTFSVSNLGMFGIDEFTAMLNPPEAGILAVGAAGPELQLRDGELVEVQKMKITLTVDHRAMDGATAAAFLRDLKGMLEQPLRMLV